MATLIDRLFRSKRAPAGVKPPPPSEATLTDRARVEPTFTEFWIWLTARAPDRYGRIVEIGVGPCGFTPFYAARADSYIGLGVDDYQACYGDVANARIVTYDGLSFPLPDRSCDLAASHSAFEHMSDFRAVLGEIWRVLRDGGLAFISVNPLYYSSWGSHGTLPDNQTPLQPWEHLDPASPHYLTDCPPQMIRSGDRGCYLNKLTMADLLQEVGRLPWSIVRLERTYEAAPLPAFLADSPISEADLRTFNFRILLRKDALGPAAAASAN